MKHKRLSGALCLLAIVAVALPTVAYDLVRSTLDGGGATSTGGTMSLSGSVGQPDAATSNGGTLELMGGFWVPNPLATSVDDESAIPRVYRLHAPAPNPFNPRTIVAFELSQGGPATVRVYDLAGRLVRELVNEALPAGRHEVSWNGQDDRGGFVASGVYLFHMRAGNFAAVRKATLLK